MWIGNVVTSLYHLSVKSFDSVTSFYPPDLLWSFVFLFYYIYHIFPWIGNRHYHALLSHMILNDWLAFYSTFWISTQVVYLQRFLVVTWLVPRETAAVSALSVYTIQPCTMTRHFMQSHIRRVHACWAVTRHLHCWQNDRDLLRATAVTRGWNGYRTRSQHKKLTLERNIFQSLLRWLEPATFRSRVRRSNHWAIPAYPEAGVQAFVCYNF